jgi:hypothetical protein
MKTSHDILDLRLCRSTRQHINEVLSKRIMDHIRLTFWELPIFKKRKLGPVTRMSSSLHTNAPEAVADFVALKFNMLEAMRGNENK